MIIEAVIFGGMLIAIGFWWRLNNKVHKLRSLAVVLGPAQKQLRDILANIGNMLGALQKSIQSNHEDLTVHIPKGQELKKDLSVIIEHGETISERLDQLLSQADHLEKFLKNINTQYHHNVQNQEKNSNIKALKDKTLIDHSLQKKINNESESDPLITPPKNFKERLKDLR